MINKVIFEGVLLNQPKLTDFGTTLLRVKNTEPYTGKDGKAGETTCTAVVSCEWRKLAEEVVNRFKQGDKIHVEGKLKKKNTKKVDQEGNEIYEMWIKATLVNALPSMQSVVEEQIKLEKAAKSPERLGQSYIPPQLPPKKPYAASNTQNQPVAQPVKQSPPTFKNKPNGMYAPQPIPVEDPDNVFEEVFDEDLPF